MNRQVTDCPFCLQNNMFKGTLIAESDTGFVTEARGSSGCYLVVPKAHAETIADLPDDWWKEMKTLVPHVSASQSSYNISLNYGANAGQTVGHLHFWIIPRETGKPSSGKGLARLMSEADHGTSAIE